MGNEKPICLHKNTGVTNSRPPDHCGSSGRRTYGKFPFECEVIRIRKRADCGQNFRTYELRQEAVDLLMAGEGARPALTREILDHIISICESTGGDMKRRNPIAKAVRKIRPQVKPDKRRKLLERAVAKKEMKHG